MRCYRPKSFLSLVLIGFVLVCLPLVLALVQAQRSLALLAGESGAVVDRSVKATEGSRLLVDDLIALERKARQHEVLGDKRLLQEMIDQHREIQQTLVRLLNLGLAPPLPERLGQVVELEAQIFEQLREEPRKSSTHEAALQGFAELNERANAIADQSNRLIYDEVDRIQQATAQARQTLLWWGGALVPVSLLFIGLFARLISRPIQQIVAAINRLGEGDFASPVSVGGTRDLAFLGQRLDWMRGQLADVERSKSRFVAQISHELKTPLASIREGSELLNDKVMGDLNVPQREIVEILCKSSLDLQKLIENLLGFSRFQAEGVAPPDLVPVAPVLLVNEVLADHKPSIMKKDLRCEARLETPMVPADPARLRILIDNLLSNAIKFTPAGGSIAIVDGREGDMWFFEVRDSGPGIAPGDRERVFQPFFQGPSSNAMHVKGTGLGLSIAREIARAHGGELSVPEGVGGRIRLTLPLNRNPEER